MDRILNYFWKEGFPFGVAKYTDLLKDFMATSFLSRKLIALYTVAVNPLPRIFTALKLS